MKIVSGKTGTSHVTSEQFRQIIEGTVGQGSYILTSGENLEPELASNNMLKIRGGMMSHHGNMSCVELNTYDEVTLTNGSQGVKRIDLIVNRYTRNDETGLEKNEWVVIIGTPDATNPKVPEYIAGNLQNGDLTDDCPVFEVHYDGINVTDVKKLLPVMSNLDLLNGKIELKMTPSSGMRFSTQWNDNYAIFQGDILYINFLIENTNGAYFKENTPHTLCKIKKPKSVKIGNRLSLSGYALSSSGSARANSGQVSLYTGTQDNNDLEVVFLTTDASTYKMNVTGALLLR